MHVRISALPLAVAAAALLGLAGLPASATHTPSHQEDGAAAQTQQLQQQQQLFQGRRIIGDDIIDSPLEMDALHHRRGPAEGEQHGGPGGHLPGSIENVELVGQVTVSNIEPGLISDVGTLGNFAYLGAFGGANCDKAGVYVIDISDPTNPTEVGFIPTKAGSFVGEGVQVLPIETKFFEGDILVMNNEICDDTTGEQIGGFSLFDVTDPLNPVTLVEGAGDTDPGGGASAANQIHSAFMWQQRKRAFVVIVDDEELLDVDIFEITDPRNPVMIAETGLPDWPAAQSPLANGDTTFFHDVVVKKVRGHWLMLLSYWDAGYIILNVDDPANPVFVNDTDFTDPDPELAKVGIFASPAEGNGHEAEFSHNSKFILATDEDFSPFRLSFQATDGSLAGQFFQAGEFGWTVPIATLPDQTLNGPTVFGGYGCPDDRLSIPDALTVFPTVSAGEERIIIFQRGPVADPNSPQPGCFFSEKVESGQIAGYDAVIVANHHNGAGGGLTPDAALCGGQGHDFVITARGACVGHRFMHLAFGHGEDYTIPYPDGDPGDLEPNIGELGPRITASPSFDGWGYVHLYDARTLQEIDTYAITESLDPAFASGFGDLSVHEVASDPFENLAYISYYAGGFRVIEFDKKKGIREVGHFIHENGNNFWGVQLATDDEGEVEGDLVLASDRDSGLWIFRYTGEDEDEKEGIAQATP